MKKLISLFLPLLLFFSCNIKNPFSPDNEPTPTPSKHANCVIIQQNKVKDNLANAQFNGIVKNNGERRADNVKVTITMYDGNNQSLGTENTLVKGSNYGHGNASLNAGEEGSYECKTNVPFSQVKKWEIKVTWDEL